ncbi:hypothetical protein A2130_01305 [Candidatus Woesebacteria bacterium GWC2_33_12]|uniref:Nucleic acid binding OB-fold tRNA/helicase-type n=1 Tax=Candidatus Woesebacteria bacterium GW2011_GWB1_33_22 TaxID=1618566 RepID=A0A0G0BZ86_9BACT|nr:MAG: Nucleic acid binding OB-fold tRNA/helicase-type [Candidatus Woesebacteria bacterium GW2011_GWC2_33_12]KKP41761.1 MAG: Nucleic acid binding OB-fold tRNA/helicase-type [Candidatus Woesebacteria bacterium GW2011_GWA2_33_20]KKP44215.1 MAG: Nucleic acid binding OB-fold tRNA/helicase-type [Candidatus Woesebacteria bacterium GW2011_GWB1_33_22]KKP45921.1 MAG: Nucleic acid binding OB-fold tRNA/helicase-type [Microgenomates group bacterium GW2011_GWC1_33_28]KKP49806.1 MAG: Nucleic acid binding OB
MGRKKLEKVWGNALVFLASLFHSFLAGTSKGWGQEESSAFGTGRKQNLVLIFIYTFMEEDILGQIKSENAKKQVRGSGGKFVSKVDPTKLPPISVTTNNPTSVSTTNPPDLVSLKITNPLVYIKYWWKRIMANEGLDMRIKVKPLTIFGVALILFSLAFGLGGVVLPTFFPWMKFNDGTTATASPTSQPQILKDTALKGTLTKTNTNPVKFYLITTSTEAVTLEIPVGFNLISLVGKRILAVGSYDSKNKVLEVEDIQDLEVLSTTPVPIPTVTPTPKPTETANPTITPTSTPILEPTIIPTPQSTESLEIN